MAWIDKEQLEEVRRIDLLTYFQEREPHELVHSAPGEYRTKSHGSLVLSKGKWFWNRGGFGGVSALDYLIKVEGMSFMEAAEVILELRDAPDFSVRRSEKQMPGQAKWKFYPPRPQRYPSRAVAYLQKRGISPDVIRRAMKEGILYESRYYNPKSEYHNAAMCVFAGKDESGKIVFAALRGIDTDFKKDKAGSDKRYNFHIPAENPASHHLSVFESPIDALSFATLQRRKAWAPDYHYLSLGGTSDVALVSFLERNPQIERVSLCLDADDAGRKATGKIMKSIAWDERFSHIEVTAEPPPVGKDYNEALLHAVGLERARKQAGHRIEAGLSI